VSARKTADEAIMRNLVKFIELNHPLRDKMEPYPGLPNIKVGAYLDHDASRPNYDDKAEFYLGKVEMVTNVGTYIDSPFHRHREMMDLSDLPLDRVAGLPAIVLDADPEKNRALNFDVPKSKLSGMAVIIRTGWDRYWGTDKYNKNGPHLSLEFTELLIESNSVLVGVDFLNVDDTSDKARPVHTRLLSKNILIVENLTNLSPLPGEGFRFFAVPLRIEKGASFPVRAFAEING
jgi:arylformamidase